MTVTLDDIRAAQARIAPHLKPTALILAPDLGAQVWLKLENGNHTKSFKIRGALNAVLSLSEEERARGLVTASSGNHAQGLAYAAALTRTRAQILMPLHTPSVKVNQVETHNLMVQPAFDGVEAVLFGENFDKTEHEARRREREQGMTFVSAYNDARVIAGAGTIGLEIIDALPDVARVVVCVSGGGLISGVGTAIKALKPDVEVIGVNAQSAPSMYNLFHGTHHPEVWDTLAEALSGSIEAGSLTLEIAPRVVDRMVMVDEKAIARAIVWTTGEAEGGGAVGIAAFLSGVLSADKSRPTVVIVSGGNLDPDVRRDMLQGVHPALHD